MSRIGIRPVQLPQGVKVNVTPTLISVEGPKGKLSQSYNSQVEVTVKDGVVYVAKKGETREANAFHGLYRKLISNMVVGVTEGFKKGLMINGVGYRAEVQGKLLVLSLGYSTDYGVAIPEGISVAVEANNQKVVVSGADRWLVGKFASEIRSLREPEPYKGKGIRYEDEQIRKKVGKTGVK